MQMAKWLNGWYPNRHMIQERSISISTRTILKVVITLLLLMFLWAVRDIIALVFTALILAALINPFAEWAAKYKIPKGVSVLVFYLLFFGGLLCSFLLVFPQLIQQIGHLGQVFDRTTQLVSSSADWIRGFTEAHGLSDNLQSGIASLQTELASMVGRVFSTVTGLLGSIAALVVVLVMTFYIVVQEQEALDWFKNFIPREYDGFVTRLLKEVQSKFGGWLLGQLALCFIVGLFSYVGLSLIGVEGALVLAILAGFTEFIPYLGPILGAIPAIIVAATYSPMAGLLTLALYFVVQQVENHILVPTVMQKAVGINPIISIVALLVGAKLFGIAGAILAIPVATACSVLLTEIWKFQKK
jgi:predicted PurR-regulated permease PerM